MVRGLKTNVQYRAICESSDDSGVITETSVLKRVGNVKNGLAVYYMNLASALLAQKSFIEYIVPYRVSKTSKINNNYNTDETKLDSVDKCMSLSYLHFRDGISVFNEINDKDNEALLTSNAGRLMRLRANSAALADKEFSMDEEHYLNRVEANFMIYFVTCIWAIGMFRLTENSVNRCFLPKPKPTFHF